MSVTKELMVPIDFNSIYFTYYESQWGPSIACLPTFIHKIFCVQKKEIHTGLEQFDGK